MIAGYDMKKRHLIYAGLEVIRLKVEMLNEVKHDLIFLGLCSCMDDSKLIMYRLVHKVG